MLLDSVPGRRVFLLEAEGLRPAAPPCLIAGLHSKCVCWKSAEISVARLSTLLILWGPGKAALASQRHNVCVGEREQQLLTAMTLWLGTRESLGLPDPSLTPGARASRSIFLPSSLLPQTISLFLLLLDASSPDIPQSFPTSTLPHRPHFCGRACQLPQLTAPQPPTEVLPGPPALPGPNSRCLRCMAGRGDVSRGALGRAWYGAGCRHP